MLGTRAWRFALVALLCFLPMGCAPADSGSLRVALPEGIDLSRLSPAQQSLLELTVQVSGGTTERLRTTISDTGVLGVSGVLSLPEVARDTEVDLAFTLSGAASAQSAQILLGRCTAHVELKANARNVPDVDCVLDTGTAGDEPVFDLNRNGRTNLFDLTMLGIDPAANASELNVAPATLQFPSGIALGAYAQQVIVVENTSGDTMTDVALRVVGAPGALLSRFDVEETPAHVLHLEDIPAFEERYVAVSFAPKDPYLVTGNVMLSARDARTGVPQSGLVKVIGNADGGLRAPPSGMTPPEPAVLGGFGDDNDVVAAPYPLDALYSGLAVNRVDQVNPAQSVLTPTARRIELPTVDGERQWIPIDAAYVVELPPWTTLSASLEALEPVDLDLAFVPLGGDGALDTGSPFLRRDPQVGQEGFEVANQTNLPLRGVLTLGHYLAEDRRQRHAGALTDATGADGTPFSIAASLFAGPTFADEEPVFPTSGPYEGGTEIQVRGRGFEDGARLQVDGVFAISSRVEHADGVDTVTAVLPPATPSAIGRSVTVVVVNPGPDGGLGQSATLPGGFSYHPPRPTLSAMTPAAAAVTSPALSAVLTGTYLQDCEVLFFRPGATDPEWRVAPSSVAATRLTVEADIPNGLNAGVVEVRVQNIRSGGLSDALPFTWLPSAGTAPTIDGLDVERLGAGTVSVPFDGTAELGTAPEGGERLVMRGSGFRPGMSIVLEGEVLPTRLSGPAGDAFSIATFTAPARAPGAYSARAVNTDATEVAFSLPYAVPAVRLEPAVLRVSSAGGALLSVRGAGFAPSVSVSFEAPMGTSTQPASSVTRLSSTVLLVGVPPVLQAGDGRMLVENPGTTPASLDVQFIAPMQDGPVIHSVQPAQANVGDVVTLLGSNFEAPVVQFGGAVLDAGVELISPNELRLAVPPHEPGVVEIRVRNPRDEQEARTQLRVLDGAADLVLYSVTPTSVHAGAAETVRLFGAGFRAEGTSLSEVFLTSAEDGTETSVTAAVLSDAVLEFGPLPRLTTGAYTVGSRFDVDGTVQAVSGPTLTVESADVLGPFGQEVSRFGNAPGAVELRYFGTALQDLDGATVTVPGHAHAGTAQVDGGALVVLIPVDGAPLAEGAHDVVVQAGGDDIVLPKFFARSPHVDLATPIGPLGANSTWFVQGRFLEAQTGVQCAFVTEDGLVACHVLHAGPTALRLAAQGLFDPPQELRLSYGLVDVSVPLGSVCDRPCASGLSCQAGPDGIPGCYAGTACDLETEDALFCGEDAQRCAFDLIPSAAACDDGSARADLACTAPAVAVRFFDGLQACLPGCNSDADCGGRVCRQVGAASVCIEAASSVPTCTGGEEYAPLDMFTGTCRPRVVTCSASNDGEVCGLGRRCSQSACVAVPDVQMSLEGLVHLPRDAGALRLTVAHNGELPVGISAAQTTDLTPVRGAAMPPLMAPIDLAPPQHAGQDTNSTILYPFAAATELAVRMQVSTPQHTKRVYRTQLSRLSCEDPEPSEATVLDRAEFVPMQAASLCGRDDDWFAFESGPSGKVGVSVTSEASVDLAVWCDDGSAPALDPTTRPLFYTAGSTETHHTLVTTPNARCGVRVSQGDVASAVPYTIQVAPFATLSAVHADVVVVAGEGLADVVELDVTGWTPLDRIQLFDGDGDEIPEVIIEKVSETRLRAHVASPRCELDGSEAHWRLSRAGFPGEVHAVTDATVFSGPRVLRIARYSPASFDQQPRPAQVVLANPARCSVAADALSALQLFALDPYGTAIVPITVGARPTFGGVPVCGNPETEPLANDHDSLPGGCSITLTAPGGGGEPTFVLQRGADVLERWQTGVDGVPVAPSGQVAQRVDMCGQADGGFEVVPRADVDDVPAQGTFGCAAPVSADPCEGEDASVDVDGNGTPDCVENLLANGQFSLARGVTWATQHANLQVTAVPDPGTNAGSFALQLENTNPATSANAHSVAFQDCLPATRSGTYISGLDYMLAAGQVGSPFVNLVMTFYGDDACTQSLGAASSPSPGTTQGAWATHGWTLPGTAVPPGATHIRLSVQLFKGNSPSNATAEIDNVLLRHAP